MKYFVKKLLSCVIMIALISCNANDDIDECSLVSCIGGDLLELKFTSNGENIFETNPPENFTVTQNDRSIYLSTSIEFYIVLLLEDDDPFEITIDDLQLNVEVSSTYLEGKCCSGIQVDKITVNGSEICADRDLCNEVLEISID